MSTADDAPFNETKRVVKRSQQAVGAASKSSWVGIKGDDGIIFRHN